MGEIRKSLLDFDWDVLVILDACRYDVFKEVNWIKGRLSKVVSLASSTSDWFKETFVLKDYVDVVYVSANPIISSGLGVKVDGLEIPKFSKIVDVWKDGWSEELTTVPPDQVNRVVEMELHSIFEKKMIVHYLQPHHPFIGSSLKELDDLREERRKQMGEVFSVCKRMVNVWDYLIDGIIDLEIVKKAYKENLKYVLKFVEKLLPLLKGRIVVSSDHGNLFGEYGEYAHPEKKDYPELLEVPYLEVDRKEIK